MIKSPTVILSNFSNNINEEKEINSISLLPFQISFDGLAPISTYFSTRTRISTSKSSNLTSLPLLESSFRGRQVLSTPINLPKGFKGLIFSTTTPTVSTINDNDKPNKPSSKKRVKLSSSDEFSQEKGKGKEIILSSITGRRTSPRKKVTVIKYSMDSDEEEEDEPKEVDEDERIETETEGNTMELDEQVHIEIIAPTSPIRSPSPTASSSLALSAHPSTSSVFSLVDTPLESQSSSQEESSQKELELEDEGEIKDVQELIPFATFNAIQIWNSDYELDGQEDVFVRSLNEWVGIGNKIHSY